MEFFKTTNEDIDAVFDIYNQAAAYQKTVNNKNWKALIETETAENRHFIPEHYKEGSFSLFEIKL